jgi:hypothetical protein
MASRCQPCQAVLGARVEGVDLRQVPDAETIETPAAQVAWSRAFGPLAMPRGTAARVPHYPGIFVVGHTSDPPVTCSPSTAHDALAWHADHLPRQVPARAALL